MPDEKYEKGNYSGNPDFIYSSCPSRLRAYEGYCMIGGSGFVYWIVVVALASFVFSVVFWGTCSNKEKRWKNEPKNSLSKRKVY